MISYLVLASFLLPNIQGPPAAPALGFRNGEGQDLYAARKPIFAQVIGVPNGRNAYEEYVRAAELTDNEFLFYARPFEDWIRANRTGKMPILPKGLKPESSLLDIQREKLKVGAPIIALLRTATSKPCFRPGETIVDTLFPEYGAFKGVVKLTAECAAAEFANGRPDEAVRILRDSLVMAHKISDGILIASLVGTAMKSIVLAAVKGNQLLISETGWRDIETTALALIAEPPTELRAILHDADSIKRSMRELLLNQKKFSEAIFPDKEAAKKFQRMDSDQKRQLYAEFEKKVDGSYRQIYDVLLGPESGWTKPIPEQEPTILPDNPSPQQLMTWMATEVVPVLGQIGSVAARSKTQIRLLALTAHIHRFRFHHGRLPNTLREAVGDAELDPLSMLPFIYERKSEFEFRLASKGTKELGEIELKYQRPTPTNEDKVVPPN